MSGQARRLLALLPLLRPSRLFPSGLSGSEKPPWRHALRHHTGLDEKRCAACLDPFLFYGSQLRLCPSCLAHLPRRATGYCLLCGEPTGDPTAMPLVCGECLQDSPPWRAFRFHGLYEGLLRDLLGRAKFAGDAAVLELLGLLLAEACSDLPRPDAIVPMPLHPDRLRQRGYNQCREMARPLSRRLEVPVRDGYLIRTRHTAPQVGLNRVERKRNLLHIFEAAPAVRDLHLLLVDDTATTGSSLRAATQALLDAGAARVDAAVVARTSLEG